MKTIIAGSRGIHSGEGYAAVKTAVKYSGFSITEVVSGTARGVDRLGELWARKFGVPIKQFPADWDKRGKAAGFIRNAEMADYADALIAVWDGESRGTKHMIDLARKGGLKVSITYILDVKVMPNDYWGVDEYVLLFDEEPTPERGDRFLVVPLAD